MLNVVQLKNGISHFQQYHSCNILSDPIDPILAHNMHITNSCYVRRLQHQRDRSSKIILKCIPSTDQPPTLKKNWGKGRAKSKFYEVHASAANATDHRQRCCYL